MFLWTIAPSQYESGSVNYDESYNVKFLPFYMEENGTVAYGIRLETKPTEDVSVVVKVALQNSTVILNPPIVVVEPTNLIFNEFNWNTRQRISLHSIGDNVDNNLERFRVDHTITTDDDIFRARANRQDLVAVCDVSDDDTMGIILEDNAGVTLRSGYVHSKRNQDCPLGIDANSQSCHPDKHYIK